MTSQDLPEAEHHYGPNSFPPESIPHQPDQTEDPHYSPLEDTFNPRLRLPWGGAEDVVPLIIFTSISPKSLRRFERKGGGDWLGLTFPGWWIKPGIGPKWELNRRTGMVTIWHYPKKQWFCKREVPEVFTAPFWEFDAFLYSLPDRFGVTFSVGLLHRYQKENVGVDALIGRQTGQEACFAFWDFLQNYMNVSKPLPELPMLEEYRSEDPATVEHDRRIGRPPRYWRDMDDETYKARKDELMMEIERNTMPTRRNQMARYVVYYHPSRKPVREAAEVE